MRRKPAAPPEPLIDQKLFEEATRAVVSDQVKPVAKCIVCAAACAPNSSEGLCWVCRRLKISAWRDSDQQTVQE
jgi:hypothetical protein